MRSICSYCEILFDLKEPLADDSETHGICEICLPWVLKNIEAEAEAMNSPQAGGSRKKGPKGSDRIDSFSFGGTRNDREILCQEVRPMVSDQPAGE